MNEFDYYPDKPTLKTENGSNQWLKTVGSIFAFIVVFALLFKDQINFIIALVLVILIHELGHFLFMKKFNYQNVKMMFVPLLGAFVSGKKEVYSQKESLWVIAGGPFPGIILGVFSFIFGMHYNSGFLIDLSFLFFVLNLMNLLPLDPLDGGQFIKILNPNSSERFLMIFALISSIVIILIGYFLESWIMVGLGFFFGTRVRGMQKNIGIHDELKEIGVDYKTSYSNLSNKAFMEIKNVLSERSKIIRQYRDMVDEEEYNELMGQQVNAVLEDPVEKDASFLMKFILLFGWVVSFFVPVFLFLFYKQQIIENVFPGK
jgi:stage IV sporulation protein FB